MSDSSRRGFLMLAGAGAAAVGAAAVAPAASASSEKDDDGQMDGPLVAYVSDLRRGEVSVMKGEREVIIHDRALCATLARALK